MFLFFVCLPEPAGAQAAVWLCLCGAVVTDDMVQRGVDESNEHSSSTFASLMQREHPVVLRRAAESWVVQPFLEVLYTLYTILATCVGLCVSGREFFSERTHRSFRYGYFP